MRTVWVIESGDYEERHPDVACDTEALAGEVSTLMDRGGAERHQISELVLLDAPPVSMMRYSVSGRLDADGNIVRRFRRSLLDGPGISIGSPSESWDFAVPEPAEVRSGTWSGRLRRRPEDFAEAIGRDPMTCLSLVMARLSKLAEGWAR